MFCSREVEKLIKGISGESCSTQTANARIPEEIQVLGLVAKTIAQEEARSARGFSGNKFLTAVIKTGFSLISVRTLRSRWSLCRICTPPIDGAGAAVINWVGLFQKKKTKNKTILVSVWSFLNTFYASDVIIIMSRARAYAQFCMTTSARG